MTKIIKKLSPLIAKQIAAGEVVERPASVLKELLENSIDANSSQINISVERGGAQLIQISDNGLGISKQDLKLALTQHATSKIATSKDLDCIRTLGFRGEALASIGSVSKLELISKTPEQDSSWKIITKEALGLDLDSDLEEPSPASHPLGTTVKVGELFYNVPARRKFLRREKTEFHHIEEVFKRVALSNFSVSLILNHNGKEVKNLAACELSSAYTKRVAKICGQLTVERSRAIKIQQNGMNLWGWLGTGEFASSQSGSQYFFINKRIVKDRLINHALRQAYANFCPPGRYPFYCLYLELDPSLVDVNVHPTKHEVRFRDTNIIYRFLIEAIQEGLTNSNDNNTNSLEKLAESLDVKHELSVKFANKPLISAGLKKQAKLLCVLDNILIIAQDSQGLIFIDVKTAREKMFVEQYENVLSQDLLFPVTVKLLENIITDEDYINKVLFKLGFEVRQVGPDSLMIKKIPKLLLGLELDYEFIFDAVYKEYKEYKKHKKNKKQINSKLDNLELDNPKLYIKILIKNILQQTQTCSTIQAENILNYENNKLCCQISSKEIISLLKKEKIY